MSNDLTLLEKFQIFRQRYFPERQLFLRSEGRVRFVTIGSYTQMVAATALSSALIWGSVTSYHYLTRDQVLEAKNRTITTMSAQYESLSNDFSALEMEVERKAEQLETRQQFLEEVVGVEKASTAAPAQDDAEEIAAQNPERTSFNSDSKPGFFAEILGAGTAQAAILSNNDRRKNLLSRLQQMEARQQQLANALLSEAEAKIANIDRILEPTKLDNDTLIEKAEALVRKVGNQYDASQADFQPVFQDNDQETFLRLTNSRQRLEMVTLVLNSFPVGKPAEDFYLSERFGYRIHPVKKTPDNHNGVDLAGWPGTAIYATAQGKVVRAGNIWPYGNMVEIDHGNGFKTRYGHMRKLRVSKGETVTMGQRIGDMGKTGRVTGTHLHYEVWFDGQVRDPMPFMKAANDVLEIQGRNEETSQQ
ncbi:M23 family metallopeptidase [Kordiimonas lacus]|uniref:Murein DD-endopeptidase MepM and murein hydrolase activator NlpD, contain LysM domain n=1 Tax=Kordiimonas lacus TaxID=637679 RepID=A0A1G6WZU6_9PROT|nr:M23 family metallopeptidase [Kordiimonas lacus]SDD70707.1 Murein DD-endopeptidase MepM and murein hydrolase activator NlpD, contain LysM domain [Kordiimonas lacus]